MVGVLDLCFLWYDGTAYDKNSNSFSFKLFKFTAYPATGEPFFYARKGFKVLWLARYVVILYIIAVIL